MLVTTAKVLDKYDLGNLFDSVKLFFMEIVSCPFPTTKIFWCIQSTPSRTVNDSVVYNQLYQNSERFCCLQLTLSRTVNDSAVYKQLYQEQ